MADAGKNKKSIQNWFKGLKAEYHKVIWTDKKTLTRQSAAVVIITAVMCALITLVDSAALEFVNLLIK